MSHLWAMPLLLASAAAFCAAQTPKPTAEQLEFFEKHVRPTLIDTCYSCHSRQADKVKGQLFLDSKTGIDKGGSTGRVIVPGNPEQSLLIQAVRWNNDDTRMPPKKKLPDEKIRLLEQWVAIGAPYPEGAAGVKTPDAMEEARKFWAFVPPRQHTGPTVKNAPWARNDVDRFVLAKLEAGGIAPSAMADRRTLIRRATFDLTGLPPTSEQVKQFVEDQSPDAWEKVIDRLLASPQYGERWARHWLDVARYSDTKGYVFQEERRYPYAYTYRDWVIDAFNNDMPYDQFLMYQLAADRVQEKAPNLNPESRTLNPHLAAMGFLTVGRRFLNNQADIIDDRLDVVFRGTQALTMGCARCHDHKYDPISIKEYYSLYGVFASSTEPGDLPVIGNARNPAQTAEYEKELARRQGEVTKYLETKHAEIAAQARSEKGIETYLLAAHDARGGDDARLRDVAQKQDLRRALLERWRRQITGNGEVFVIWNALIETPEKDWEAKGRDLSGKGNAVIATRVLQPMPKSMKELAGRYAKVLAELGAKEQKLEDPAGEQVRLAIRGEGAAANIALAEIEDYFRRDEREKVKDLRNKIDALSASHPGAPARAMVMVDLPQPVDPHVFVRGNPANRGARVPRKFLEVMSPGAPEAFKDGSGRLELARKIASMDNPLTARVMVNRVWAWHFGFGLVRTPSDFGTRGDRPTHPELLDTLAVRFMNDGWSIKKLHKQIMMSAAYQQASDDRPDAKAIDPENTLLWKFNRQRLNFEAMRDSLLFASGQLDPSMFGQPVDITQSSVRRRSIYGFIDRQNLPGMFRAFDFAGPDQHAPLRFATTVPQQALFMMNAPFVIDQAKALAKRYEAEVDTSKRAGLMYQALYQRDPTPAEVKLATEFVASEKLSPWERYAQVLLLSNEFVFVD